MRLACSILYNPVGSIIIDRNGVKRIRRVHGQMQHSLPGDTLLWLCNVNAAINILLTPVLLPTGRAAVGVPPLHGPHRGGTPARSGLSRQAGAGQGGLYSLDFTAMDVHVQQLLRITENCSAIHPVPESSPQPPRLLRSEHVQLVGRWRPNFRGDAVDVVLLSGRKCRALKDALGHELGVDEGELGGPLEEHKAHVAIMSKPGHLACARSCLAPPTRCSRALSCGAWRRVPPASA